LTSSRAAGQFPPFLRWVAGGCLCRGRIQVRGLGLEHYFERNAATISDLGGAAFAIISFSARER